MHCVKVLTTNPRNPEDKRYFAKFQSIGTLKLESDRAGNVVLGAKFEDHRGHLIEVADYLANRVKDLLEHGYEVDLGSLGKFSPSFHCEGQDVDAPYLFDPNRQIKKVTVRWTPSRLLRTLDKNHRPMFLVFQSMYQYTYIYHQIFLLHQLKYAIQQIKQK